jgi:hypothetical protein
MFFVGVGFINVVIWAKSTYYDPKFVAPAKEKSQKELEGILFEYLSIIIFRKRYYRQANIILQ